MARHRFCDDYDDDDDDYEVIDDSGPEGTGHAEDGPAGDAPPHDGLAPVWTGLFTASGDPIMRHPVRVRVGFHRDCDKLHCPTEGDADLGTGAIVGWSYAL